MREYLSDVREYVKGRSSDLRQAFRKLSKVSDSDSCINLISIHHVESGLRLVLMLARLYRHFSIELFSG